MRDLATKFDVVIEAAGARRTSPLDSIEFAPRTIRCTIAPFVRTGPKSEYAATDFTVMAASGAPAMTGDLDRPPLFFPVPQAMMEAGADAAIAALAGLIARDRDGARAAGGSIGEDRGDDGFIRPGAGSGFGKSRRQTLARRDDDCRSASSERVRMRGRIHADYDRLRPRVRADDAAACEVGG